jgi:phage/plasmid-like protein (TIGR03299 family)
MAHEIVEERFLSYRRPAWHGLGQVITEEIGAVEAGNRIGLPYVFTEPLLYRNGSIATDHKAIIGRLADKDTVYAVVSDKYREITHDQFAQAWDKIVKQHVDTIGLLSSGAGLFISAKLPTIDIAGDEVDCYILAENWLSGIRASRVRKTPVRVVCMNTLQMSDSQSIEELRITHLGHAVQFLETALDGVIARSIAQYQDLKTVYELLAATKLTSGDSEEYLKLVYPAKPLPAELSKRAAGDPHALDKLAEWERFNTGQIEHRDTCQRLFLGDGRGSQSRAAAGTVWGGYNAVAEYEQYRKKYRKAESLMFGAGKDRVAHAFTEAATFAGHSLVKA